MCFLKSLLFLVVLLSSKFCFSRERPALPQDRALSHGPSLSVKFLIFPKALLFLKALLITKVLLFLKDLLCFEIFTLWSLRSHAWCAFFSCLVFQSEASHDVGFQWSSSGLVGAFSSCEREVPVRATDSQAVSDGIQRPFCETTQVSLLLLFKVFACPSICF